MKKGSKHNPESISKISISKKDSIPWNKGIKGYSTKKKGQPVSEETKQKISNTLKGNIAWNKGKKWSLEHKQKLSKIHTGKKLSEEHKEAILETKYKNKNKRELEYNVRKGMKLIFEPNKKQQKHLPFLLSKFS